MSGSNWLKAKFQGSISPFGEQVADLLSELYLGLYHMPYRAIAKANWANNSWISITVSDSWGAFATVDGDMLTRLVVLAHKYDIRVQIEAATHGYLELTFGNLASGGYLVSQHPKLKDRL
jgi:hypothetical protein